MKSNITPEQPKKLKELTLRVQYFDPLDLKQCLFKIIKQIENGENIIETKILTANISAELQFLEKREYTEKQINNIWYQIVKSKI